MSLNKRIALDSAKTTIVTFLVQALSFVISAVIAAVYGATSHTDAYFYGLALVLIFTTGITGILKSVFVPVFLRYKKEQPTDEKQMLGSFYFVFALFTVAVWGLFLLSCWIILNLLKINLGGIEPKILWLLVFQMSFLIILTSLVECYSTVYNAYQYFIAPLITPLIRSIVFILFVFSTRELLDVQSLSLGNVFGELAQLIILIIVLWRKNISLKLHISIHASVKRMVNLSFAPFLSNAMTRINSIVDSTFVAPLLIGGVTMLNYANKISGIPEMLLTGAFLTVILSYWSLSRVEDGLVKVGDSLEKAILSLSYIFVPILSFMFFLRLPLVQLMYERKNFTYDLSVGTASLLGFYLIGILPLILGRVLTRAFLVIEDTWTPFWVGNIRFVLNILANYIFIVLFGFVGIAISTTVTSFFMFFYMFYKLRSKIPIPNEKILLFELIKMSFIGIVCGAVVAILYGTISRYVISTTFIYKISEVGLCSFAGLLLYFIFSYVLKLRSVNLAMPIFVKVLGLARK